MQERDTVPTGARARRTIDERDALGIEASEFALEVLGAVGDVVQSLALSLEEAADGGVGTERLEQLHDADEGDADALGLQRLRRRAGVTGDELEESAARVDGVDGHGDVVERPIRREGWGHGRMLCPARNSDKETWDGDE